MFLNFEGKILKEQEYRELAGEISTEGPVPEAKQEEAQPVHTDSYLDSSNYFSEIIRKYLGKNDLCGRYGGDEFAAIIQGDHLNVGHLLEEANKAFMDTQIGLLTTDFTHSFSYGMASFQESDLSLDTLYKLADKRIYQEKSSKQKRH